MAKSDNAFIGEYCVMGVEGRTKRMSYCMRRRMCTLRVPHMWLLES